MPTIGSQEGGKRIGENALISAAFRPESLSTKHLKNIFDSGELQENSVSSILEHTADDSSLMNRIF